MGAETIQHPLLQKPKDLPSNSNKLSLLPLVFLIYFEVAGGPFGVEPAVKAAGPLLAILGFLIFPFIWSVPEALITAELATAYPGNGGFVIWTNEAFGPFWGFLMGTWKFFCGVINLAAFPMLCINYLQLLFPILSSGFPGFVASVFATSALSFLNYTGLTVVGYAAVAIGILSLLPFIIMALFAIPNLDLRRWVVSGEKGVERNWGLFFNTLFWNLNFWDNASTLAGEVEDPQKSYPKALLSAGVLACLGYLVPLMAAIGALPLDQQNWEKGYLAEAAELVVGKWLKYWVEMAAVLSVIGLFQAQLSSCAYQLMGMADLGFLPKLFGERSVWFNTPWAGILVSTVAVVGVSSMEFEDVICSANFLYSLGMVLEFGAFIWLRRKKGGVKRPFRVPMEVPGLVGMCLIPTGFLVFIMGLGLGNKAVLLMSGGMTLFGVASYFVIRLFKPEMGVVVQVEFTHSDQKLALVDDEHEHVHVHVGV